MKKRLMKESVMVALISLFLMLTLTTKARALDVTASSCSRSDVKSAITQVEAAGGGTVNIPTGDCTWDGGGYSGTTIEGDVNIIGAGIGQTILRVTDGSRFFSWNSGSTTSSFFELSGITFYSDLGCTNSCQPATGVWFRNVDNYRIHNNYFEGYFSGVLAFKSVPKGLIDNNTFINRNVSGSGSYYGITSGQPYDGTDPSWQNLNCGNECDCQAGEESKDRPSSAASGNTVISSAPAVIDNASGSGQGTVRRIYINIASASPGDTVSIASFIRSGNVFTARARTTNLAVQSGLNIFAVDDSEFTAFAIYAGDYIGVYLNGATLEASSGSTGWTVAGDQTNQSDVNFGSPDIGAVSMWLELFDNEGDFAACEQHWIDWYSDETRGGGFYKAFNRNWVYDVNAHYIEDNTFIWYKSAANGNWGGSAGFVMRHNTFYTETGAVTVFTKPGNNFLILHDNLFEWTAGDGSGGYTTWTNTDGLIYNNTIRNIKYGGSTEAYRHFGDHDFPFYVRPKEVYIWSNTYDNADCGTTESDCWYSAGQGINWVNQPGENGSIHFRAPKPGERLYDVVNNPYPYPHPLRSGEPPPPPPNPLAPSPPTGLKIISP